MHFSLVKMNPEDSLPSHGFDDVILPLYHALRALGFSVEIRKNSVNPKSRNIVFGSCIAPRRIGRELPANSIIFNLEQFAEGSMWANRDYLTHLRDFTVWDYSRRNIGFLAELGVPGVVHVPLGYVPEMTRLRPDFPQDIDVLFYGAINERRREVLQRLQEHGVHLLAAQGVFGETRDVLIARAKLILNIHYYIPANLEVARLGYLWANSKAVVSEWRDDTECEAHLAGACAFFPHEKLAEGVMALLADDAARREQAERGFAAFASYPLERTLEHLAGRRAHSAGAGAGTPAAELPAVLNAGSGKDFMQDALNVDIAPLWAPDIVLDVSLPLDFKQVHASRRFGEIALPEGHFARIIARDVLEHVRDLPQTMENFCRLLREEGEVLLEVPYDLSLGAWQDPTHVRGFNENSWKYYGEWAWYLGWRDWQLALAAMEPVLSPHGQELADQKQCPPEDLLRIPRAVDALRVTLVKRRTSAGQQREYDMRRRTFLREPSAVWQI